MPNVKFCVMGKKRDLLDKAKILYNHIWFSQLEDGYIDEIYRNKRYLNIIKHDNYNPYVMQVLKFINNEIAKSIHIMPENKELSLKFLRLLLKCGMKANYSSFKIKDPYSLIRIVKGIFLNICLFISK